MTTRQAPATAPAGQAAPSLAARARDVLAFEWIKLRSIRSNSWTLAISALVTLAATVLVARSLAASPRPLPPGPLTGLTISFLAYAEYAVLPVSILGALAFTSEYSTGLIRATFTAVPRRRAVLAAKAVVTGAVALAAGEVLAFGAFGITQAVLSGHGGLSLSQPGAAGAVVAAGAFLPACVIVSLSLGAIIRHTAGAIAAAVGVIYFLGLACLLLPDPWRERIGKFTLVFAASQVVSSRPQPGLFSPAVSMLVLVAWPVVALTVAAVVLTRRDA